MAARGYVLALFILACWRLKPCDARFGRHGDSIYKVLNNTYTYDFGKDACKLLSSDLGSDADMATVDSDAENFYLKAFLNTSTWIGMSDDSVDGTWRTVKNTVQQYFDWANGEPNGGTTENCAHFHAGKAMRWSDGDCSQRFSIVCEGTVDMTTLLPIPVVPVGEPFVEWIIEEPQSSDIARELVLHCNKSTIQDVDTLDNLEIKWYWGAQEYIQGNSGSTLGEDQWKSGRSYNNKGEGKKVRCEVTGEDSIGVSLRFISTRFDFSDKLIKVDYRYQSSIFNIQEGNCIDVTIVQQIPFLCDSKPTSECYINLLAEIEVNSFVCQGHSTDHVNAYIVGDCNQITFNGTGTDSTVLVNKQRATIEVCGSYDGKNDPFHRNTMTFTGWNADDKGIPPYWFNEELLRISVEVVDLNQTLTGVSCELESDPNLTTFDGVWYSMQNVGTFIPFQHDIFPLEVQTTFKSRGGGSFICGFAIIAWDSYFVVNRCDPDAAYELYYQDRQNLKVVEERVTIGWTIFIKTGTMIKVYMNRWGRLNMDIYPSYSDWASVSGLCGNFNGNQSLSDEFFIPGVGPDQILVNSSGFPPIRDHDFGEYFRVPDDMSVVQSQCPGSLVAADLDYGNLCTCNYENVRKEDDNCVDHKGAVSECFQDPEVPFSKRSDEPQCVNKRDLSRVKRQATNSTAKIQLDLSWKNGWNETTAGEYCENKILSSSVSNLCADIEGVNLTRSVANCLSDIQLTGGTEFSDDTIASIFTSCFTEVLKNVTVVQELTGNSSSLANNSISGNSSEPVNVTVVSFEFPEEFVALFCGSFCDRHGECINNGTCQCDHGYYGDGCDIEYSHTPYIQSVSECVNYNCSLVILTGFNFTNVIDGVSCRLVVTQFNSTMETTNMTENVVIGTYLSSSMVSCPVPDKLETDFATFIEISASNNDFNTSSNRKTFLLTHECVSCSGNDTDSCQLQDRYCFIDNRCHPVNSAPETGCFTCKPDVNQFGWTITDCITDAPDSTMQPTIPTTRQITSRTTPRPTIPQTTTPHTPTPQTTTLYTLASQTTASRTTRQTATQTHGPATGTLISTTLQRTVSGSVGQLTPSTRPINTPTVGKGEQTNFPTTITSSSGVTGKVPTTSSRGPDQSNSGVTGKVPTTSSRRPEQSSQTTTILVAVFATLGVLLIIGIIVGLVIYKIKSTSINQSRISIGGIPDDKIRGKTGVLEFPDVDKLPRVNPQGAAGEFQRPQGRLPPLPAFEARTQPQLFRADTSY